MKAGLFALMLVPLAWSEVVLSGVVRSDADEKSLTKVKVRLPSGKELGTTDKEGRFEFVLPSERMSLIFEKAGFEPRTLLVSELKDPIGVDVYMHSAIQVIETVATTGIKNRSSVRLGSFEPLNRYEAVAGMKLDLTEQLALVPGMSGKQDFSGKLSYLGARPGDLALDYNGMELPWPQHLDFGFPGNMSGLSPKLVGRARLDRSAVGAASQAGSLSLVPLALGRDVRWDFSAGNALFENFVAVPTARNSGLVADFRFLNPVVLKNLGQKYFAENRRQDQQCSGEQCSNFGNAYDLSAMDAAAYYRSEDSTGAAWSASAFWLRDRYDVQQDTSRNYLGDGAELLRIFGGSQDLLSLGYLSQAAEGGSWGLQWLKKSESKLQRDTASQGAVSKNDSSLLVQNSLESQDLKWNKNWDLNGSEFKMNLAWKTEKRVDSTALKPLVMDRDLYEAAGIWSKRAKIQGGAHEWALGLLGRSDRVLPGALARMRLEWADSTWARSLECALSSKAWDRFKGSEASGVWQYDLLALTEAKFQGKSWTLNMQPFGRLMQNPEMPTGDWVLWRENQDRDQAWTAGASLEFQYEMVPNLRFRSLNSHLSGAYMGDNPLAWSENRLFESQNQLRFYPMSDTNFSVILSHRISLGQPLYQFALDPVKMSRTVQDWGQTADLYRTDLRFELDLPSKVFPLQRGRLYFEADNLFASLESDALKFLGSQNLRQRGWTVEKGLLTPYMSRGQGLFLMFGIDASLGF